MARLLPAVLLVSSVGCGPDLFDELARVPVCDEQGGTAAICAGLLSSSTTGDDASTSGGGQDEPTTSGIQTVTGASEDTSDPAPDPSTTAGPPQDTPPTIELFTVTPGHLDEAGSVELQLIASEDVVAVRLSLDGQHLANLTPADFPRTWDALSAKDNGPARTFEVVVEDTGGLTAAAVTTLGVQVPAPGVERCLFEDPDKWVVTSSISALKYTREAILAVGVRDAGAGFRMTVWALDPDHCEVALPGWPKTIAGWSGDDEFFNKVASVGTAIDVDAYGHIVVGGNLLVDDQPQSYVALLNSGGSRLWQHAGLIGDEVTSVVAATGQYKDRVFVGGARRTSKIPVRTDAAIWVYQSTGEMVFVAPPEILAAPFTRGEAGDENNEWNESVRALMIRPGSGNALAVGERELKDDDDFVYSRAFTAQVHPLGGIVGTPWTSWAPSFKNDAALALALCGEDILAGGWTRDEVPDAKPQPMMFWIEDDGSSAKHRDEPQLGSTEIHGIACDREAKIVSAATRDVLARDARVFTVPGQNGPRTMYETGAPGDDGAGAVACDPRGFCGWGGYRTDNGKPYAVVRVHHP